MSPASATWALVACHSRLKPGIESDCSRVAPMESPRARGGAIGHEGAVISPESEELVQIRVTFEQRLIGFHKGTARRLEIDRGPFRRPGTTERDEQDPP